MSEPPIYALHAFRPNHFDHMIAASLKKTRSIHQRLACAVVIFIGCSLGMFAAEGAEPPASFIEAPNKSFAIQVFANGLPIWLTVDTGSGTILDPSLKRPLGLKYKGKRSYVFASVGKVVVRQSEVTISVPGFVANAHPCYVASMKELVPQKSQFARGFLGTDFLSKAGAIINFRDNSIRFTGGVSVANDSPKDMLPLPFDIIEGVGPTIKLRINGRDVIALIDTGCIETTALWDAVLPNEVGVKKGPTGVDYTVVDRIDFINQKIGTVSVGHVMVNVWLKERPGADVQPLAAITRVYLGLDLLRYLGAIIDYPAGILYISKEAQQRE